MKEIFTISDLCYITTGKLDSNAFVANGKYPFYTCAEEPLRIDIFEYDEDAVLVAGNNARGNFHVNRFRGKFNAYQRTYILTSKGQIPIDYIYYALKLELKRLKDSAQGSQTKFLTIGIIRDIPVVIIKNLHRIASFLSYIDTKIELNNQINQELEAMAKMLYDYWFVQFDFPNEEGKPYKSSGGKMFYNEELKREIPEGWEVGTLLDIASFANGLACQKFRPTNDEYFPVIKIREMREGFTESTEKVRRDIPEKLIVNDGDVLFSWSASLEVMIWSGGQGGLNQHIFKVTSEEYPKSFYYFQLMAYLEHFKMIANLRKTTMGHITQEHLKQSRIVIPPIEFINELDNKLKPIQSRQLLLHQEDRQLSKLRDWLLPMLMNGQVKVKDAKLVEEELGEVLGVVPEGKEKYKTV